MYELHNTRPLLQKASRADIDTLLWYYDDRRGLLVDQAEAEFFLHMTIAAYVQRLPNDDGEKGNQSSSSPNTLRLLSASESISSG